MKKIKYLLFAGNVPNTIDPDQLVQSGLFCWQQAMNRNGCTGYASSSLNPEFLQGFDVVHVNMVPGNYIAIKSIHEAIKDSSTKLVMNLDYSVDVQASIDPYILKQMSGYADFMFHVEPHGADLLEYYLGRPIAVNPHPCCVELLQKKFPPGHDIVPTIMCQYHRYQYTWNIYYYSTLEIKKGRFFKTILANYIPGQIAMSVEFFFDDMIPVRGYAEYVPFLAKSLMNMDIPPSFVGGRGSVDAAALGVPTIGSTTSYCQKMIWPELVVEPTDFRGASCLLDKLIKDPVFYGSMVDQGIERSRQFGLEASQKRFIGMLEEAGVV